MAANRREDVARADVKGPSLVIDKRKNDREEDPHEGPCFHVAKKNETRSKKDTAVRFNRLEVPPIEVVMSEQ